LCAVPGILDATFCKTFSNILMAALIVVFAIRLAKTRRFMPAGMMLAFTLVALALRNIHF